MIALACGRRAALAQSMRVEGILIARTCRVCARAQMNVIIIICSELKWHTHVFLCVHRTHVAQSTSPRDDRHDAGTRVCVCILSLKHYGNRLACTMRACATR